MNPETNRGSDWFEELGAAVTVTAADGTILRMNAASIATFAADGGAELIGKSVFDCHPEPARTRLRGLLDSGETNVYTIEKAGRRKLVFQSPWYSGGTRRGLVEISLEIPEAMPHFVRG